MSVLQVMKYLEHHVRMKHLNLQFYPLRDEVTIRVEHIAMDEIPADLLIKPLTGVKVHDEA